MMKGKLLLSILMASLGMVPGLMSQIVPVQQVRTSAYSSSPATNLLDHDPATVWSDEHANTGAGSWVEIRLYEPMDIDRIELKSSPKSSFDNAELILDNQFRFPLPHNQQTKLNRRTDRILIRLRPLADRNFVPVFDGQAFTAVCAEKTVVEISDILIWSPGHDSPRQLRLTKEVPGKVYASSVEEPATFYHPVFLFDGRNDFGWGTDHGEKGAGEALAFSFDDSVRIEKVRIVDGFAAWSKEPYVGVERMNFAEGMNKPQPLHFFQDVHWDGSFLDLAGGKKGQFGVADSSGGRWKISAGNLGFHGNLFLMRIEKVNGPEKESDMLNIQELEFFDGKEWFRMQTEHKKLQEDFVRSKTQETIIGERMDHVFHYHKDKVDVSLSFRSDGAFFMILEDPADPESTVWMHGAWENLPPDGNTSLVRVQGLKYTFKGGKADAPEIVEEILRLEGRKIHGSRHVPSGILGSGDDALVPCDPHGKIAVDLRYKTKENFLKQPLYPDCLPCLLRKETALALQKAQALLDLRYPEKGLRLLVWDAYRPYEVQKKMWAEVPDSNYVANPYTGGSSHNKGYAVDLTLSLDGINSIPMGTTFDFFGEEAQHAYRKLPKKVRENRALLRSIMEEAGFVPLETEWWHYKFPGEGGIIDLDVDCK